MGGRVSIHLALAEAMGGVGSPAPDGWQGGRGRRDADDAARATARTVGARALDRIRAWADRLTRFSPASELSALNLDVRDDVVVRPTLGAVLAWAQDAAILTDGIVDATLLDERLAAEWRPSADDANVPGTGSILTRAHAPTRFERAWGIRRRGRAALITRPAGLRFDLDGIAKGWLADRALGLLGTYPTAVVDADGDMALRLARGQRLTVGIAHPLEPLDMVASLGVDGGSDSIGGAFSVNPPGTDAGPGSAVRYGIATSGTSVHRWGTGPRPSHHIIDPRTRRPAVTDVLQATVVAASAREAEAWAKTAIVLGSQAALRVLDRDRLGLALVTDRGELLATLPTLRWLA